MINSRSNVIMSYYGLFVFSTALSAVDSIIESHDYHVNLHIYRDAREQLYVAVRSDWLV